MLYFGGCGCQQHYETVYGNPYLSGKTAQLALYLSARAHYNGKNFEEVNVRIQAATRNWARMGRFGFRSGAAKCGIALVYSARFCPCAFCFAFWFGNTCSKTPRIIKSIPWFFVTGTNSCKGRRAKRVTTPMAQSSTRLASQKLYGSGLGSVHASCSCKFEGSNGISNWRETGVDTSAFSCLDASAMTR